MIEALRALHAHIGQVLAELAGLEPLVAVWQPPGLPVEPDERAPLPAGTAPQANGSATPGQAPAPNADGLIRMRCPSCGVAFEKRRTSKRIWCSKRCKMKVYAKRNAERRRAAAQPDPAPLPDFTERDLRVPSLVPEGSDPDALRPCRARTARPAGEATPQPPARSGAGGVRGLPRAHGARP